MKVVKVTEVGRYAPPCTAKVHLSATPTRVRMKREDDARRAGLPPDQCGLRSVFRVDDQPMCQNHAGQAALSYLLTRHRRLAEKHRRLAQKAPPAEAKVHLRWADDYERHADYIREPQL